MLKKGGEWGPEISEPKTYRFNDTLDYPTTWVRWEVAQSSITDDVFIENFTLHVRCYGGSHIWNFSGKLFKNQRIFSTLTKKQILKSFK